MLTIGLASPADLFSLTIFGRTDCCSGRDIYNLTLLDASNHILFQQNLLDASGSTHEVTVNFGMNSGINAAVPEPEQWLILLVGLPMIAAFARRKYA